MASKVGSPIIPLSIVASGESMPSDWIFPRRRARGLCKVVVHEPIESNDKTEEELAQWKTGDEDLQQEIIDNADWDLVRDKPIDDYSEPEFIEDEDGK